MKVLALFAAGLALGACGTRLSELDSRAVLNQERACATIDSREDGGPNHLLANACVCGARGILTRAGQPSDDAGSCN